MFFKDVLYSSLRAAARNMSCDLMFFKDVLYLGQPSFTSTISCDLMFFKDVLYFVIIVYERVPLL